MKSFSRLSIIYKILIFTGSLVVLTFLMRALPATHGSPLLSLAAFILLFVVLLLLFNLADFELYTKIFIGLATGILAGLMWPQQIIVFEAVGKAFILLIRMIVVPLVFASILVGTASIGDVKKLGRIGAKTLAFYLISTALAITIGLSVANALQPGSSIPPTVQQELKQNYQQEAETKINKAVNRPTTVELLLNIIPRNPARSMADSNMLQIIFFAIISGIAVTYIAEDKRTIVVKFFDGITDITIQIVHFIMKLAPYGVFALIAVVIGKYGSSIIFTLFGFFVTTLIALALHVSVFNSLVVRFLTGLSLKEFWKGIYPAMLVAFSTSSSSATLPVTMECAEENLKVKPQIASFVLPLGSTINMDGTAIFQGVAALFIAKIYGMDLGLADQLTIVFTATLASIGTAGAPQVGIIMLTLVLESIGIPLEGIALILGVERFLDMARTTVNITSDLSCSAFISHGEQQA